MDKVWVKSGLNPDKISIIRQGQPASYCLDSNILAKLFFCCRAPEGCLQFFTGSVGGQLTSFNYLDGLNPIMIRNLLYSVCIRAEKGKDDPVIRMKCLHCHENFGDCLR